MFCRYLEFENSIPIEYLNRWCNTKLHEFHRQDYDNSYEPLAADHENVDTDYSNFDMFYRLLSEKHFRYNRHQELWVSKSDTWFLKYSKKTNKVNRKKIFVWFLNKVKNVRKKEPGKSWVASYAAFFLASSSSRWFSASCLCLSSSARFSSSASLRRLSAEQDKD